jgi:hypothetical protein
MGAAFRTDARLLPAQQAIGGRWDADADEFLLYNADDEAPRRLKRSMESFLERLFFPSSKANSEGAQMRLEALAESDALD